MKAKELRIDNLLEYFIGEEEMGWVMNIIDIEDLVWCERDEVEFNNAHRPIELTEEWLLKFGFTVKQSSVCKGYYIGENPVTKDWLFDLVFMRDNGQIFYKNSHFNIKFVHQLQNLYYALTQTELTIKP